MAVITIEQPVTHNLLISYIYLLLCVCRRPTLVGYVITITRRLVKTWKREMAAASFRWILQLHKDVPKAARFYSEGLDFTVNVCTLRWAELQSGPLKLALMQSNDHIVQQKGYSSLLSFTVTDINSTVTKLMAMGAELDGSIKYEIHGKVASMRCIDGHMLGLYEPA
ncbi:uncharacterized protein LOC101214305 isoform X1 [Cucumis sativus]|uniref:uncharacterized protein LOC101214305 isoform X1 n=1 Tax=Cucumis sativus TaxID=3659 RepID=UPI0012F4F749|nr:uncharacterized protein LOC101214305 isoform X1 [Cucumis sativus]KAE8652254.1 hypothetical protein Csa_021821 [Cucumis sativus]